MNIKSVYYCSLVNKIWSEEHKGFDPSDLFKDFKLKAIIAEFFNKQKTVKEIERDNILSTLRKVRSEKYNMFWYLCIYPESSAHIHNNQKSNKCIFATRFAIQNFFCFTKLEKSF